MRINGVWVGGSKFTGLSLNLMARLLDQPDFNHTRQLL
jgi:hypothetical protein